MTTRLRSYGAAADADSFEAVFERDGRVAVVRVDGKAFRSGRSDSMAWAMAMHEVKHALDALAES